MSQFEMIPIGNLSESPTNPRRSYNEAAIEELAASIRSKGVLQPLLVRPRVIDSASKNAKAIRGTDSPAFEIVAGSRRFRASRLAGLAEAPCMVRDLDDDQVTECQVIENLQREDVHPLEEAEGYSKLIARGLYDVATIAEKVGKSERYIFDRMKLRDLGEKALELLSEEKIGVGVAQLLSRLQPADQEAVLYDLRWEMQNGMLRTSKVAEYIGSHVLLKVSSFPFKASDATLVPSAGACTTCPRNTASQPLLFPDEKGAKSGLCTDRGCHMAKVRAHEDRLIAKARADIGAESIDKLSDDWFGRSRDDVVHQQDWHLSEDEDAKHGFVVDGNEPYRIVRYVDVVRSVGGFERAQPTPEKRAEDRERARMIRVEMLTRRRVFDAVVVVLGAWAPKAVMAIERNTPYLVGLLAYKCLEGCDEQRGGQVPEEMRHPGARTALEPLGLKDVPSYRRGSTKPLREIDLQHAWKGAFIAATANEIYQDKFGGGEYCGVPNSKGRVLFAFAELLGVDVDGIRRDTDWELLSKKAAAV